MNNFQQTVNLKKKMERDAEPRRRASVPAKRPRLSKKAHQIDQVFEDQDDDIQPQKELQTIQIPKHRPDSDASYRKVLWVAAAAILLAAVYWQFFYNKASDTAGINTAGSGWYAVKLMNDEIYYGQIDDTSADPVIIKNVYYNYDQLNPSASPTQESGGNLRLVKRGKETHGPDGTMSVVRGQVVYMEPLKEESKVLSAILKYEN